MPDQVIRAHRHRLHTLVDNFGKSRAPNRANSKLAKSTLRYFCRKILGFVAVPRMHWSASSTE